MAQEIIHTQVEVKTYTNWRKLQILRNSYSNEIKCCALTGHVHIKLVRTGIRVSTAICLSVIS